MQRVADELRAANKVLLTAHRRPDADALGSMVALASLLGAAGKRVTLFNPDRIQRSLKWLPLTRRFVRKLPKDKTFDLTIVVDTADRKLLGDTFPPPAVTGRVLVLDHHASSRPFGDVFACDPGAASVGVLVARLARLSGWPIGDVAAQGIYLSLAADTGSFKYSNTNAEALHLAAELVDGGIDPWTIYMNTRERVPIARYRLMAAALATLELTCEGKVAVMTVTADMVKAAKASWDDTEGFVNIPRSIDKVECGALITTAKGGGCRISLRSKGKLDVGAICAELGGGGHPGAGGCLLPGDIAEGRKRVEQSLAVALAALAK